MPTVVWIILSSVLAASIPALIASHDPVLQTVGAGLSAVFGGLRIWQKNKAGDGQAPQPPGTELPVPPIPLSDA